MSANLEEVDVEQQLKKAEESGDDTTSIVLSEKSEVDSDDEEDDIPLNEDIDDVKEDIKEEAKQEELLQTKPVQREKNRTKKNLEGSYGEHFLKTH